MIDIYAIAVSGYLPLEKDALSIAVEGYYPSNVLGVIKPTPDGIGRQAIRRPKKQIANRLQTDDEELLTIIHLFIQTWH